MSRSPSPRGSVTAFIAIYLYKHGPCKASQCLRALATWQGLNRPAHDGMLYFYRGASGERPRRGLQFGHKYTTNVPSYIYPGPAKYWMQLSKRSPWALTALGHDFAISVTSRKDLGYKFA